MSTRREHWPRRLPRAGSWLFRRPRGKARVPCWRAQRRTPRRLRTLSTAVLLSGLWLTTWRAASEAGVTRFVHLQGAQKQRLMVIDGTALPVLDPAKGQHVFRLQGSEPHAVLEFSVGLTPLPETGEVRFQILLRPEAGKPVQIYEKEMRTSGWLNERIDLAAFHLRKAELVFRRTLLKGPPKRFSGSAWGNPRLVSTPAAKRPSAILISLDTLRADHVGAYGYTNVRTPSLDGIAKAGVRYENSYSPSTWTRPSHTSLFSGTYPSGSQVPQPPRAGTLGPSPRPRPMLAEIFRDAGYLTAGFTGGGYVAHSLGFARGFDTYYMFEQLRAGAGKCDPKRFDGPEVFRRATEWLRQHRDSPFFLFVHTYDIHDRCPFRGPESSAARAWNDLGEEGHRQLIAYYDELITRTDRRIGDLLRTVDQLGLRHTTLVVVTSDHGEAFSEHGFQGHGKSMKPYEEVSRVPLILRYPAVLHQDSRVISSPVSLTEVAPTMVTLMGVPTQPGARVLPGLGLAGAQGSEPIYIQSDDIIAVRWDRFKLITSKDRPYLYELYDLKEDPLERRNIAAQNPTVLAKLRHDAVRYWNGSPAQGEKATRPESLDETTRERLKALGYLK